MRVSVEHAPDVHVLTLDGLPLLSLDVAQAARLDAALRETLDRTQRPLLLRLRGGAPSAHESGEADPSVMAALLQRLADADRPTLAVLEGEVAGLGVEIALACRARLLRADASLSFPHLRCGRLPVPGSLDRLLRRMDAMQVLDLFAESRIAADAALRLGLIDAVSDGRAVRDDIAAIAALTAPCVQAPTRDIPSDADLDQRRAAWARRYRQQPAAQKLVDAVQAALRLPQQQARARQATLAQECAASPEAAALAHLFSAERHAATIHDLPPQTCARSIERVAVIGGGTMGTGIAIACLDAGLAVTLLETSEAALQRGVESVHGHYRAAVARGRLHEAQLAAQLQGLQSTLDDAALVDVDLVIEAVFEDLAVKQSVFRRLAALCRPGCILATNTSYLDVDAIASVTGRAADVVGLHFFSPAHVMKLVEVVRAAATAPDTLLSAVALAQRLGKIPVLAGVCHGFIGNRMLRQYNREVQLCLIEGASPQQIDTAMERWGLAMGPLAVADLAGLDIGYRARQALAPELRGDPRSYAIADALVEMGRLGRKSGAGYYRHAADTRAQQPDPVVDEVIRAQALHHGVQRRTIDDGDITRRLLLALVNEGARLLEEGIAQCAADIDVVYCNGYGFPAFRGGPMYHAEQLGLDVVCRALADLRARHGEQWTPAPLLEHLARSGASLRDWRAAGRASLNHGPSP